MFTNGVAFSDIDWTSIAGKVTDAYSKRQAQKASNLASDARLQAQAAALQQANIVATQQQPGTILGMSPAVFYGVSGVGAVGIIALIYALSKR